MRAIVPQPSLEERAKINARFLEMHPEFERYAHALVNTAQEYYTLITGQETKVTLPEAYHLIIVENNWRVHYDHRVREIDRTGSIESIADSDA